MGQRGREIAAGKDRTAAFMALLALVDPSADLTWVLVGFLVANLLAATQDIATDGLAVRILENEGAGQS